MKEKINEIASKFAVLAAVALVSWASFAELVVTRATKGSLWNDDLVVVDVKELGGGVNTNAVLSLIESSVGGTNSLAHAVKTNDQGVASIDGLQVSYVGANMITGNSGVLWLGSGQTSPGTSITYDASTGNDVLSAAVVMDAAGNVLSAKANRSEIPDVTADFTSPTSSGKAADAKAVGDAIGAVEEDAEHAQETAAEALDGAATAYNMASEAQTNAVTAVEYANEAYERANEALDAADTADNHAQLAYELAETKYLKDAAGIPLGDLEQSVQDALAKADSALQDEQDPFATAKANAAIAAAGLNRAVLTNEEGFVEGEFSVSGNIYANNGLVVSDHGVLVNDGTGGYSVQYDADGVWYAPSGEFWYHPWYRPDGWRSDSDHFYATVGDIDDATNGLAKTTVPSSRTINGVPLTNDIYIAGMEGNALCWTNNVVRTHDGSKVLTAADFGAWGNVDTPTTKMLLLKENEVFYFPDENNPLIYAWGPNTFVDVKLSNWGEGSAQIVVTGGGATEYAYLSKQNGVWKKDQDFTMMVGGAALGLGVFGTDYDGNQYNVSLPYGGAMGQFAIESWSSLSRMLADANSNTNADCACIRTNLCKLISPKMDEKPHLAFIDGELHIITITETED